MATAAAFSPARISAASVVTIGHKTQKKESKVVYIRGLNSYGGLKAQNSVASLGMPVCTEQCFANVISSLKATSNGKGKSGGALSAKCSKIGEIVQIAATLNGLTLLGVAVGFVLLRMEAFVEESAE
ncbi:cytochrome b6f complex subunit (petM) putative [Euphorbia peplus]|nr:cytochrome b6f complex subunit (petM) putative [Euphorbia peplus]